jgi:hypothetical protein
MDSPGFDLRPCITAGQTAPDDYFRGDGDGSEQRADRKVGLVHPTLNILGAAANGRALNLDEAKKAFRRARDARPE